MKRLLSCLCGGLVLTGVSTQAQTTLAQWTFESTAPSTAGPVAADTGSGSASGYHASTSTYSSPAGNGSTYSYSSTAWSVGDYWQFQTSTLGSSGISLSWDQVSSSTGPVKYNLEYSVDGGTTFLTYVTDYTVLTNATSSNNEGTGLVTSAWSKSTHQSVFTYSYDLSSITALNNLSTVYFRLVDDSSLNAQGATVPSTGTDRVDNFTVTAATVTVVPEPTVAVLGGLALLGFIARRR